MMEGCFFFLLGALCVGDRCWLVPRGPSKALETAAVKQRSASGLVHFNPVLLHLHRHESRIRIEFAFINFQSDIDRCLLLRPTLAPATKDVYILKYVTRSVHD